MPRKPGQSYPVDNDWRKRAETRMRELGISRTDLARLAGVSKSTITELLNGSVNASTDLPKIHRALEMGEFQPALSVVSGELGLLITMWESLDEFGRGRVLERTRTVYEEHLRRRTGGRND